MGRTSTARERLLDAAGELLHSRGYTAAGVAEICAHAGVRKGSFYHFFASKQTLTLEAVDAHWAARRTVWDAFAGADGPPLDRLHGLLRAHADAQRADRAEHGSVRGCLLGNLGLELSGHEPGIQARIAAIFAEQAAMVRTLLTEAARTEAVADDEATARAVVAQLEGTVLLAKLADDLAAFDGLWPAVRRLIRTD
ncbi:TetR family transcriptional regulator [Kitasatospora sp. NBC_01539]|uniref:TetR family transcriptional regulator n=1 Tax=Kitasatospora sp. NBC_01539 TaxID=2903577 RepID=UPI00386022C3